MITVKDIEIETVNVSKFLREMKKKQKEVGTEEITIYSKIPLYTALKHKIFFINLLLHPEILVKKKFFQEKKQFGDNISLKQALGEVLQYEMTLGNEKLSIEERTRVINLFNKLQRKELKSES